MVKQVIADSLTRSESGTLLLSQEISPTLQQDNLLVQVLTKTVTDSLTHGRTSMPVISPTSVQEELN